MGDGFLGRWSRRKQEVREGKPVAEPPPPSAKPAAESLSASAVTHPAPAAARLATVQAPPPEAAAPPPAPTLEDAQALTPASDFKAFVAHGVPADVRNLAMKKLFADPHFNVMDGLDIYVGDYTQPDPLPTGALRKMVSAHAMGFFDHEKKAEPGTSGGEGAIAPAFAQPRDDSGAVEAADVAQSGVCNAVPSVPTSEPALADRSATEQVAAPASHTHDDHDAHLRLQPDDAPQRQGDGRGTA